MSELIELIKLNSDEKTKTRIDEILSVNDILNLERDILYCSFDFNMAKIASLYLFFETNKLKSTNIKNAIKKILEINNKLELFNVIINTNKNLIKQMERITNPIYGIGIDLRNINNPEIKTYYRINNIHEYIDENNNIIAEKTNIDTIFNSIRTCMNINEINCSFLEEIKKQIKLLDITIETIGVDYLSNNEKELKLYCSIDKSVISNKEKTEKVLILNKEMSNILNIDSNLKEEIIKKIQFLNEKNITFNTTCLSIKNDELIEIKNTIDTDITVAHKILTVKDLDIKNIVANLFDNEEEEIIQKIENFKIKRLIPDGFGYDFNKESIRKKIYLIPNNCLIKT